MRIKMMIVALSVLFLMTGSAFAADITGTWIAEMAAPQGGPGGGGGGGMGGPSGPMKFTFNFKADGSKLTGTQQGPMGQPNDILEGKIDGSNISFIIKVDMMGNEMKFNYKGTVSGDEIKMSFTMEGGMGGPGGGGGGMPPMEMTAKRQ
jgi:hypothetical protein